VSTRTASIANDAVPSSPHPTHYIPGACYFFTVALLERRRHLLTEHIDALREAFRTVRKGRPFSIDAIVVLPEHLHCIWTLPEGDADFSTRWRLIKARFARSLPGGERRSIRRLDKGERAIWQRRFWEHVIRDEADLAGHVDYRRPGALSIRPMAGGS
jgi:putative transposase